MMRHESKATLIQILIIVAVAIAGYSNTFSVPFVLDDFRNISENPVIKDIAGLFDWSRLPDLDQHSPTLHSTIRTRIFSYLSFALNYRLHGLTVEGFHLVNLAIHIANGILVFALTRIFLAPSSLPRRPDSDCTPSATFDLARWLPLLPALLFVSHPIQTQAVTYIVQRMTSLATFFILLATVCYIHSRHSTPPQTGKKWYFCALVSALVGLLTKEFTLVLPVILASWEFLLGSGSRKEKIGNLAPFFLAPLVIPALLFGKQLLNFDIEGIKAIISTSTAHPSLSAMDYFFTQFRVFLTYMRLLLWPTNQNVDYDFPVFHTFWTWPVAVPALLILAVLLSSLWTLKISEKSDPNKRTFQRLLVFLVWAFFLALIPESSVFPIADVIFEHRMYFPSIWFFIFLSLLVGYAGEKLPYSYRFIPITACIIVIISLISTTWVRNQVWQNEETLWRDVTSKSPGKARGHQNLAIILNRQEQYPEALAEMKTALSIEQNSANMHLTMSDIYRKLGQFEAAIEESQTALSLKPNDADCLGSLGSLYLEKGDLTQASAYLQQAQQIAPENSRVYYDLARLYTKEGRNDLAKKSYLQAIDLRGAYYQARYNLGLIYLEEGDHSLAEQQFRAVIGTIPTLVNAYNKLVVALASQGQIEEARVWGKKVLDISPDDATAKRNWAALAREGLPK